MRVFYAIVCIESIVTVLHVFILLVQMVIIGNKDISLKSLSSIIDGQPCVLMHQAIKHDVPLFLKIPYYVPLFLKIPH